MVLQYGAPPSTYLTNLSTHLTQADLAWRLLISRATHHVLTPKAMDGHTTQPCGPYHVLGDARTVHDSDPFQSEGVRSFSGVEVCEHFKYGIVGPRGRH